MLRGLGEWFNREMKRRGFKFIACSCELSLVRSVNYRGNDSLCLEFVKIPLYLFSFILTVIFFHCFEH